MTKEKNNKKNAGDKKPTTEKEILTKESNLAEAVYKYPQIAEVLMDFGLHCVGCFASAYDTIEAGAKIHGLSDKDIKEMIARVNEVIIYEE